MSTLLYLKNIIKDKHIASITPTSSSGVRRVCSKIDFTKDNVILEYGPAAGVFTKYLLKRMTNGSELILIERNHRFVSILKKLFKDQRVTIYHDSANNVNNIIRNHNRQEKADYIVSGIPFSFLPECVRAQIVADSHQVLNKGGKFLPYQTFLQKDHHLKDHIDRYFSTVQVEYHLFNAPPLRIYEAVK
jgi:phospholipid N-methyltransferase